MKNYKFWFCTGSQDLYGDECLRKVAEHSAKIVEGLNNGGKLPFEVVLKRILKTCDINKKIFDKILDGLSLVDKKAKIQTKRNGEILYDKATSETEIVRFNETIESYMEREVLPYVPDAQAFFEESSKKPKIGAEIPFVRYFYKYQQPVSSEVLAKQFLEIEHGVSAQISELFKDR